MSIFGRRDELPNGSMLSGPTSFEMPSVTPATKPYATEEPPAQEPETESSDVEDAPEETMVVEEVTSKDVATDTAPIPVQASASTPLLYDERLHIKYMFTFYSGPFQVLFWVVTASIVIPILVGLYYEIQEEWMRLEAIPILGILARTIRIIIVSIAEALWGVVSSLLASTGVIGAVAAGVVGFIVCVVMAVLIIRPIFAWRISRVQVGYDRVVLLRPGNKYLFLDDHSIRIGDTSIIRGATEEVLASDRWIFPGAGIVTIDKDDLGGRGDDKPWEPVRKYEQLVESVGAVIAYHKAQQNRT